MHEACLALIFYIDIYASGSVVARLSNCTMAKDSAAILRVMIFRRMPTNGSSLRYDLMCIIPYAVSAYDLIWKQTSISYSFVTQGKKVKEYTKQAR